jgi:dipeptidyl aminopeptidase/acylaminoacyl peptidase
VRQRAAVVLHHACGTVCSQNSGSKLPHSPRTDASNFRLDQYPELHMATFLRFIFVLCYLVPAALHAEEDAEALHNEVAVERARVVAPRLERADFVPESAVHNVVLSPDGSQVAFQREQGSGRSLWLLPSAGDAPKLLQAHSEASTIYWSRDGRWLMLESEREIFALAVAGQSGSGIVTTLGGRTQRAAQGIDPSQAAALLVVEEIAAQAGVARHWQLLRIDMQGRRSVLHSDSHRIVNFAFDGNGRLAFLARVESEHIAILRIDGDAKTTVITRCIRMRRCTFLSASADGTSLLLHSDLAGDLARLVRLHADGSLDTLHIDPRSEADLDEITADPMTHEPMIVSYRSNVISRHGLNAVAQRHLDAITRQLPDRDLRISIGHGDTANWLINERASQLQGERWHLYSAQTLEIRQILDEPLIAQRGTKPVARLPEASLARKIAFAWRASDGMRLHGFLSLPPGADPARLPLIANVHGGPWNQSQAVYAAGVQLLVNRGYAVFEPNFRGSTGHGRDYMFAAQGDFGNGRVQQDIVEGVRYLLDQGIGDAERVGIVGASFGGYSTLLGVTFAPDLFKVGVAAVPPADFSWDLRWVARSSEALNLSRYIPFEAWLRMLSLDINEPAAMTRLSAQSPLANAAAMNRPLLLIAAGEDRRVAIRGVIEYAARLKLLGKDVSLLIDDEAGHSDSLPLAREAGLYLMEKMLAEHLGGGQPTAPDAELERYLERNLRLRGNAL